MLVIMSKCIRKEFWFTDVVSGDRVYMFWLKNGKKFMATSRFSLFRVPVKKLHYEINWACWRDHKYFTN
jgi:hypothetical protein